MVHHAGNAVEPDGPGLAFVDGWVGHKQVFAALGEGEDAVHSR